MRDHNRLFLTRCAETSSDAPVQKGDPQVTCSMLGPIIFQVYYYDHVIVKYRETDIHIPVIAI